MIDYIEIEQDGFMYKIPKRDDIDDWREWIVIWKNEGVAHEQVQRTIDRYVMIDSIKIREDSLKLIIGEYTKENRS